MKKAVIVAASCLLLPSVDAFAAYPGTGSLSLRTSQLSSCTAVGKTLPRTRPSLLQLNAKGPKPIHTKFTVEKATEDQLSELDVKNWPTWSTAGSAKYQVGKKSPLKVYDCNELSYIISGKMEIIPEDTGEPVLVQAGDFVTFPNGFPCYWHVIEEVNKHWYLY